MNQTKSQKQKCPHGHKFGIGTDEYDDCDECQLWDTCSDLKDNIRCGIEIPIEHKKKNSPPKENKATYIKLLQHPKWQRKRLEILSRDNFTCQTCDDTETMLHCHHKKYTYGNAPWECSDEDLITLCSNCHTGIENAKKKGYLFDVDTTTIYYGKFAFCMADKSPRVLLKCNENTDGMYFEGGDIKKVSQMILNALKND